MSSPRAAIQELSVVDARSTVNHSGPVVANLDGNMFDA